MGKFEHCPTFDDSGRKIVLRIEAGARCACKPVLKLFGREKAMVEFCHDLENESIRELPLRDAIVVYPNTLIRAAVAVMRNRSLGCAVIVEEGWIPTGLFTEQSLLKVLMQNASLDDRPVRDFAEPNFLAVKHSEPISRVWNAIQREGFRFICVTDDDGKLIGVTGQRGIAEYIAEYFPQQVMVQRLGSTPWMQQREGA
jgi:CBS domain-containing protein